MDPIDFWALVTEHCTQREIDVILLRASGYSHRETADELGCSRNAARKRFQRATKRLRSRTQTTPPAPHYEGERDA